MSESIRLFIAIDLPQEVREKLYQLSLEIKSQIKDLRPTKPDNIHLTLKFLGYTPSPDLENIKNALEETASKTKTFKIKLEELGAFPNFNYFRVLWASLSLGEAEIKMLKENLDEELSLIGIEKDDRAFKVHITFARIKPKKRNIDLKKTLEEKRIDFEDMITIKALHLYQSTLTRSGPIYTKLHTSNFSS